MAGTDSIVIPVELGNLDVEKFLQQLGPKIKERIAEVARGMVGGQVPQVPTTVVAKQRMDIGGKTFEATSRARLSAIQQSIGEGGEEDILSLEKIAIAIREVRKQLTQEEKTRLENIKQLTATAKKAMQEKKEFIKSLVQLDTSGVEKQLVNEVKREEQERKEFLKQLTATAKKAVQMKKDFIKSLVQLDITSAQKQLISEAKREEQDRRAAIAELTATAKKAVQMKKDFIKSLVQLDVTSVQKQTEQLRRQAISDLKTRMSIQNPEDRIKSIQQAIKDGLLPIQEGNALLAKESKRFVDSVKSARRSKFNEFTKRLQTIDPNIAVRELDTYINQRTSAFVQDAKILRDRLRKQIQSSQQQAQQARTKQFANQALVGAGIGLGALGAAGFPLLNIGFAAMSGGPVGALVVGIATALGESTRAFNRFKEATTGTAKELGFISTDFKIAEARMKAFDAVIGSSAMASQRAANELRREYYEKSRISGPLSDTTRLFEDFWVSVKQQFTEAFGDTLQGKFSRSSSDTIFETFRKQRERSADRTLPELESARSNFIAQMNKSNVGIETNPYETWRRIQTAAFDPMKQEEMRIFQAILKDMDEMIAIERQRENDRKSAPTSINGKTDWGSWLGTL